VKGQACTLAAGYGDRRLPGGAQALGRRLRRGLPGGGQRRPADRDQGIPPRLAGHPRARRAAAAGAAGEALAVPPGAQELLRRGALAGADLPRLRGERAELLPRERDRLHGDELPGGRDPAGLHHHRARAEEAEGLSRVDHPLAVRRDPARAAHRAPAQDAAPGHQAGQHLHHRRQQGGDDRFRRRARGALQGGQLHPPDVHARLRRARDVPARFVHGPLDRHLRDRCLHLCGHAGLSAERRAAAAGEGPPGPGPVAPAWRVLRQPDRGGRVVHVARSAVAPAVGVRAAKGAEPRGRAPLHQVDRGREDAPAVRQHGHGHQEERQACHRLRCQAQI
ncbi:MAG: Serine/threonine protein kinase, partial [uncultured Ramlibacter sp.]